MGGETARGVVAGVGDEAGDSRRTLPAWRGAMWCAAAAFCEYGAGEDDLRCAAYSSSARCIIASGSLYNRCSFHAVVSFCDSIAIVHVRPYMVPSRFESVCRQASADHCDCSVRPTDLDRSLARGGCCRWVELATGMQQIPFDSIPPSALCRCLSLFAARTSRRAICGAS